mmetsp:Transcript_23972/g.82346  ORF Transcript_23972/g.82346 Transcript_23972/m.82346 type:complete len:218 (-) Transcript_23972:109-762(-)
MSPSDLATMDASSACWMCSAASHSSQDAGTSTASAKANLCSAGAKPPRIAARRSLSDFRSRLSPSRKRRSKAMTMTSTVTSSTDASFLRVDRRWNGRSWPVLTSMATTSASRTNDFVPLASAAARTTAWTSGHFFVVSWRLREKTLTSPLGSMWAWKRSPSYLCSHVIAMPPSRLSTSPTDFVGLASMGKTGTPTARAQASGRAQSGRERMPSQSVA